MSKKMLIDATHAEETRVAVVDGARLEEFDYESEFRKPLKGSIFLAKVTRVEPSLQAAFVNFGGNRHGFLPFSEIHPDYFRIPISDREALIAEQEAELERIKQKEDAEEGETGDDEDDKDTDDENEDAAGKGDIEEVEDDDTVEEVGGEDAADDATEDESDDDESGDEDAKKGKKKSAPKGRKKKKEDEEDSSDNEDDAEEASSEDDSEDDKDEDKNEKSRGNNRRRGGRGRGGNRRRAAHRSQKVEVLGGTEYDDEESNERFRFNLRRHYKIQEVIKRGQIMLVQASREERGNKGAAVSTYLSLPGRYCVLMPNSPHAGGVSRKISNYKDRQKMRKIMRDLETPKGMSVIVRTAGMSRTKTEIKRDLDYLMRLWGNIRELTLQSTAPALIYEEANLIKRCIRDLYTRDIDEVMVAGEEGYKTAKEFMKMMIPSHAKRVKEFESTKQAIFTAHNVEDQITEINQPEARLKSGGYLVINPTEALVSIDVNSGKATKERHIEGTALKTNMEAAEEVARQLRLRDLGGLVVIDFIDMEDRRNNAKVERKLKEALSGDRARIQLGRISSFGLLEMSRQRMNPSLTESQFESCKNCGGLGRVRTADATTIMLLRAIEEEGAKKRAAQLIIHVAQKVAMYLLNHKRSNLGALEERYGFEILIRVDEDQSEDGYRIEVSRPLEGDSQDDEGGEDNQKSDNQKSKDHRNKDDDDQKGGNRRRGRRGGRRRSSSDRNAGDEGSDEVKKDDQVESSEDSDEDSGANDNGAADNKEADNKDSKEKKTASKSRSRKTTKKKDEDAADEKDEKPKSKARKSPSKKKDDKPASPSKAKEGDADKSSDEPEPKKVPAPANNQDPSVYETVNEEPENKKKGWWNKLVD